MMICLLNACSHLPTLPEHSPQTVQTPEAAKTDSCLHTTSLILKAARKHQVQDAQHTPIIGIPTYRTNRFWSDAFRQATTLEQQLYIRRQLHQLGMNSLEIEWHNLPATAKKSLQTKVGLRTFQNFESECGKSLWEQSLLQPLDEEQLLVADSYSLTQRLFGVYALTKWFVLPSVRAYQKEMRHVFEQTPIPSYADSIEYRPSASLERIDTRQWIAQAMKKNPLALPDLPSDQLKQLALHHAPQWRIGLQSPADRIGSAHWKQGLRHIDTKQPTVYFHTSYMRFQQQPLLQLNYHVWFSERPKTSSLDLYGGELDGLIWRVTLLPNGRVLLYDTIHPCGCYHSVHVPEDSPLYTRIDFDNPQSSNSQEPILFFALSQADQSVRPLLLIEPHTHYLFRVVNRSTDRLNYAQANAQTYELIPYQQLRSLPLDSSPSSERKSWFDPDGLIAYSQRMERFLLWPLGVPNAGAMRQQGHHAIAFIGRRHFDEPSVEALLDLAEQ